MDAELASPKQSAKQLLALMDVVHARFHIPPQMLARIIRESDPVVTCTEGRIRFEVFSACASVYGRLDLLDNGFTADGMYKGTTNVDFNADMLRALHRVRAKDGFRLRVGSEAVDVDIDHAAGTQSTVVEKKVDLPQRWLRGFVESGVAQSRMRLALDITAAEAGRFLRSLPRQKTSARSMWVVPAGRGLRLSQVEPRQNNGVPLAGAERLRMLEPIVQTAKALKVYVDDKTGASAWVLAFDDSHFSLVLSPEVWRGFSGEGQTLAALASSSDRRGFAKTKAALAWGDSVDVEDLASTLKVSEDEVTTYLSILAAKGVVGFDVVDGAYFHRPLPLPIGDVEKMQPRLRGAKRLLDKGAVRIVSKTPEVEADVDGTGCTHRVTVGSKTSTCTCPWYAKHGLERGPCKHILAVTMATQTENPDVT